jgi:hypothetical protein
LHRLAPRQSASAHALATRGKHFRVAAGESLQLDPEVYAVLGIG